MIKHIIFDFDGTIVDSATLGVQILNAYAGKYEYRQVTMEDVHILMHAPVRERFKTIGLKLRKIPKMSVDCMTMFKQQVHTLKAFEGIEILLPALKEESLSLSVISSNAVDNITHFLQLNHLNFFDHIISANNLFGKHKTIKRYAKQNDLKLDEIIYIGDELRDIEACKKVGVRIISVAWGFDPLPLIERGNPDYIAKTPQEVLTFIQEIKRESLSD